MTSNDQPRLKINSAEVEAYATWEAALEKLSDLGFDHLPDDYPPLDDWLRVPAAHKDADNKSASVKVSADGCTAYLYDFVDGCLHTIRGGNHTSLTAYEKHIQLQERQQRQATLDAIRRKKTTEAIEKAQAIFENSKPCLEHCYLKRKRVALPGCRTDGYWLLVPLTDPNGRIQSIQRIAPDGTKRLFAGAPLRGSAYRIGDIDPCGSVYVSEGAATGGSIHEETNEPVVCAMAAANLEKVARDLRKQHPQIKIIIAGDDDRNSIKNIGRKKAITAAQAVDGFVRFPSFCNNCDGSCSDHNDVALCIRKNNDKRNKKTDRPTC